MTYEYLIAQKVLEMTAAGAAPGIPTGPVIAAAGGEFQRFTHALICSHPSAGTHAVLGTILIRYLRAGGPGGRLGYPTSDELASGAVRYSRFVTHRAALVWHPTYIVHDVYGAIGDAYWASGGPGGPFGAPISDEYPDGLGRSSDFEHGTIHWSAADGILEILAPPVPSAAGDFSGRGQRGARQAYTIIQLVERYGYPINGAAGLVGNLTKESYVVPACVEGAPESRPLHAKNHAGVARDFSPVEVMTRVLHVSGPQLPGAGLAQWTSEPRRTMLFTHAYRGTVYGADNLRSLDLQIDYLVWELGRNPYARRVDAVLRRADVTLEDASDAVLLHFEIPGGAAGMIETRRTAGREALAAFRAMTGTS